MTEPRTPPPDAAAPARAYARIRYRLLLIGLAVGLVFLAGVQWSGASAALARWWTAVSPSASLQLLGYLAVLGLAYELVTLPLHLYGSFFLEHRFGLSRLTARGWLIRELKRVTVSALISLVTLEGFYAMVRYLPSSWPLWATAGWVGLHVLLARIFPTVLLPIFYKTSPLQHHALVTRLLELCERAGLPALGVFRFNLGAETRKANAALAGLGRTRRVLLADTLLESFPPEEIEGVLAHELAHHRYHHISLFLVLNAVGSWIAFRLTAAAAQRWAGPLGLDGLADLAGVPALLLWFSVLGLLSLPVQNGCSRFFERQADRYAVAMTRPPQAFAAALRRLAQLNLADPAPPRWVAWLFYDHPPITERIRDAAQGSGA
jgi:STE24 endopeptidase